MSTSIVDKDSMKHHCKTKKEFYSNLTMKNITDADHKLAKTSGNILKYKT